MHRKFLNNIYRWNQVKTRHWEWVNMVNCLNSTNMQGMVSSDKYLKTKYSETHFALIPILGGGGGCAKFQILTWYLHFTCRHRPVAVGQVWQLLTKRSSDISFFDFVQYWDLDTLDLSVFSSEMFPAALLQLFSSHEAFPSCGHVIH